MCSDAPTACAGVCKLRVIALTGCPVRAGVQEVALIPGDTGVLSGAAAAAQCLSAPGREHSHSLIPPSSATIQSLLQLEHHLSPITWCCQQA